MPDGSFGGLIVTSANALMVLEDREISPDILALPLFLVGQKSAVRARNLGFTNIYLVASSAHGLAQMMSDQAMGKKVVSPLLYICGVDVSPGLVNELTENGYGVASWVLYRAKSVNQLTKKTADFLSDDGIVGIPLYSARSAHQVTTLISRVIEDQHLEKIRFFAISDGARNALPAAWRKSCCVAESPDECGVFALIPLP